MLLLLAALVCLGRTISAQAPGEWQPVGPTGATVQALAVDPGNPKHALAGTYFGGIYETGDGGRTWKHQDNDFGSFSVFALTFDRRDNRVVYAGTLQGGALKSVDGGASWTTINNGLSELVIQDLAIDPNNSQQLIAVAGTALYLSRDGGESWVRVELGAKDALPRCVTWDNATPDTVYLGTLGRGVFRSTDAGETWAAFNEGIETESVNALSVAESGTQELYVAGASGYVFKTSAGLGKWEKVSVWPEGARAAVMQVWAHPATINVLVAGTLDGAYLSRDDGKTWTLIYDDTIGIVRSDPFALTLYVGGIGGHLWTTRDLGKTFESAMVGMQNVFVGSLAEQRVGSERSLYAGTEYGIFTKTPGSEKWEEPTFQKRVFTVEPHPRDANSIYAGTEQYGVWRSVDSGQNWESRAHGMTPNSVYALEMSRGEPAILYAGTSSGLYYSIDSGLTWDPSPLVTLPKVLAVATDPELSLSAYFGGFGGKVYRTFNAAQSLEDISLGLPEENIIQLRVPVKARNTVYAVTAEGRLFVSQEFGRAWTEITPAEGGALTVEVEPGRPWIMYVGTRGQGVLKSETAGIDWRVASEGMGPAFVFSVAVDPENYDTVYAGTESALYRSTDGASSWTKMAGLPAGSVTRVLVDPEHSERLYALVEGQGIYRSEDQGDTWQRVAAGLPEAASTTVAFDARTPSRLYAGIADQGVFVTADRGETWKTASAGMSVFVRGVAFDAADDAVIYAGSLTAGLFRSDDSGASWKQKGLKDEVILGVRADPKNGGTVYVATTSGLIRSVDYGETWKLAGQRISFVFSVAVDPRNRDVVYLGGLGGVVLKSTDGGRTWTPSSSGLPRLNIISLAVNPDTGWIHAAVEEGPIYLSEDGGQTWKATGSHDSSRLRVVELRYDAASKAYYASTSNQGVLLSFDGRNWAPFSQGLPSAATSSVTGVPGQAGTVLVSTGEAGVLRSVNGSDWAAANQGLPSTRVLALAANGEGPVYALLPGAVYRSDDGGDTWTPTGGALPQDEVQSLAVNPLDAQSLAVAASGGRVYLSRDGGSTWSESAVSSRDWPVRSIEFGAEGVIYAGTLGVGLSMTRDGGGTWSEGATPDVVGPFVASIAVHPEDSRIVYAGTAGGVIRSDDRGESWHPAMKGLPKGAVLTLAIDPAQTDRLYAGTAYGVYTSDDGGQNWQPIAKGMFHRNVTSLLIDTQAPGVVYAGTEGGGVFRYVRP